MFNINKGQAFEIKASNYLNQEGYLISQNYIRYNNGIWSMNYFRNIKHRNDDFKYNGNTPLPNRRSLHQEDSLIYGKYFVFTGNSYELLGNYIEKCKVCGYPSL